jgi:hypothetical protein
MSTRLPASREDVGLPAKCKVVGVLHNRAADKTIVEVQLDGFPPRRRLFARASGAMVYSQIGAPGEQQSLGDAVTGEAPQLYACLSEVESRDDLAAGKSLGVVGVDLLTAAPTFSEVDLGTALPGGAWVSRLLRVDAHGNLEAIVAFRNRHGDGRVHYAICLLNLVAQQVTELDTLRGVFF